MANFAIAGLLGIAFAVGLYRALPSRISTRIAALLLVIFALAVTLEAFRTDRPPGRTPRTWNGWIHEIAFLALGLSAIAAALLLARGLWNQPRWRGCGPYSLATAAILLVTFSIPGQLPGYLFVAAVLLWVEFLAIRLRSQRHERRAPLQRTRSARSQRSWRTR